MELNEKDRLLKAAHEDLSEFKPGLIRWGVSVLMVGIFILLTNKLDGVISPILFYFVLAIWVISLYKVASCFFRVTAAMAIKKHCNEPK